MAEYVFKVNGITRSTTEDKPLLRYLRDDLHLKSVKDGCSEGACGTCTIIVDGRAVKSCVLTTKKAVGTRHRHRRGPDVRRAGGLCLRLRQGAARCSAASAYPAWSWLARRCIDKVPGPDGGADQRSPSAATSAAAPATRRSSRASPSPPPSSAATPRSTPTLEKGDEFGVGQTGLPHRRAARRSSATASTATTSSWRAWCYGGAVRSQYARARVLDIDTSKARGPARRPRRPDRRGRAAQQGRPPPAGLGRHDRQGRHHPLRGRRHLPRRGRDAGDSSTRPRKLVKVEYEVLEPVRNVQEAMAPDAPKLHPNGNLCQQRHVVRGDAKKALAESKYVVTKSYRHPLHRARLPRARVRRRLPVQGRREGLHLRPGRLRHPQGDRHHARLGAARASWSRTSTSAAASAARRTSPPSTWPCSARSRWAGP